MKRKVSVAVFLLLMLITLSQSQFLTVPRYRLFESTFRYGVRRMK